MKVDGFVHTFYFSIHMWCALVQTINSNEQIFKINRIFEQRVQIMIINWQPHTSSSKYGQPKPKPNLTEDKIFSSTKKVANCFTASKRYVLGDNWYEKPIQQMKNWSKRKMNGKNDDVLWKNNSAASSTKIMTMRMYACDAIALL